MTRKLVPLAEVERDYIMSAVEERKGSLADVADGLGIGLRTLYRKLHEYGYEFAGPAGRPVVRGTVAVEKKAKSAKAGK